MKVKHIEKFLFDFAQYRIHDDLGNAILLKINYKQQNFSIDLIEGTRNNRLVEESSLIAKDLLQRKCGVNLAEQKQV